MASEAEVFEKNDIVVYAKNDVERLAKIVSKHMDDYPNLYYTIAFEDGNEKRTDSKFLRRQTGPLPAAAPLSAESFEIILLTAASFAREQRSLEHELKQLGERSGVAQSGAELCSKRERWACAECFRPGGPAAEEPEPRVLETPVLA